MTCAPGNLGTALAAPNGLRVARDRLEVIVAHAERVPALGADGFLRGAVDSNEAVAVHRILPFVSLSTTAREGPARGDAPSRARSAAREPLTAGSPV